MIFTRWPFCMAVMWLVMYQYQRIAVHRIYKKEGYGISDNRQYSVNLKKAGLTVPCQLQLKDNEKLIDQQSKMLLIVPVPADSILMTKALVGYSDVF